MLWFNVIVINPPKRKECDLVKYPVRIDNLTWWSAYITPDLQYIPDKKYKDPILCARDCSEHNCEQGYTSEEVLAVGEVFEYHRTMYQAMCN